MMLADITRGFADPAHGAQQAFRALLDAMARPGRAIELPPAAIDGIEPPAPMRTGLAALLLTLLDAETTVCLAGAFADEQATSWLRFHCGVREAPADEAAFVAVDAAHADTWLWNALDTGTDEMPQRGATLLVEVPALRADPPGSALALRGPGIASAQRLAAAGLSLDFWRTRVDMRSIAPRGIDLVLSCGTRVAAIPRSTRVAIEE